MYKLPKPPIQEPKEPLTVLKMAYELMCNSANVTDHSEILLCEETDDPRQQRFYFSFETKAKVCYNTDHLDRRDVFEVLAEDDSRLMLIYVPSGHDEIIELSQFIDYCGLAISPRKYSCPFDINESYFTVSCSINERLVATELMFKNYEFIWDTEKFIIHLGPGGDAKEVYQEICQLVYDVNGLNFDNTDILFIPKS